MEAEGHTTVRWTRWAAYAIGAGLLALILFDLIGFQFRDSSPYATTGVDGRPRGPETPGHSSVLLWFDVAVALGAGALLAPAAGMARRRPRLAAVPVLAAALGLAFYVLFAAFVNPLQVTRCRTDACMLEQDGPGWYLPARGLLLIGVSVGVVTLLVLSALLLLRRPQRTQPSGGPQSSRKSAKSKPGATTQLTRT
ncbi:hypothetical protein AB0H76_10075 [Nocardia sp. NPDC050712]|uniref:hypothetical protein n=1 Tax=Nocardia sp. NPDC050712 TaxID=3155518 RepID=UPI0033FC206C